MDQLERRYTWRDGELYCSSCEVKRSRKQGFMRWIGFLMVAAAGLGVLWKLGVR